MDKALLADDGVAGQEQAKKFASGFCRRALCHVVAWLIFFALALVAMIKFQALGTNHPIMTIVLYVLIGSLGLYFLLTLMGLYLRCRGQLPVDLDAIAKDGGTFVKTSQGRIVEYFVWGSQQPNATVAVLIHGQACTGKGYMDFFYRQDVLERLNVKAIAPSLPGHGYTDAVPNRRIAMWPKDDLEPILNKENVQQFMVQGWSYGTAHAMATASYFGADKCRAMGLNCPYLCRDVCRELGFKTDADMIFTEHGTDSAKVAPIYALLSLLWGSVVANGMSMIEDTKVAVKEEPEMFSFCAADVRRGAIRGVAAHIPEMLNQETNQVWQDPRTIKTKNIAIWYGKDDTQCPPAHGKWLAELFEARASEGVKCHNRAEKCQWGHFSYVKKAERDNGIMTRALLELMSS